VDGVKRVFQLCLIVALLCLFAVGPAGKAVAGTVNTCTFQVGQNSYTNGGASYSMDAAPYIDQGRAFVPLRYLAYGMGLTDNDIVWNESDSSVTIAGLNNSNQVIHLILRVGSNFMEVDNVTTGNNSTITMDVTPEIRDGRTYLPARWVVEALSGDVSWDGQTGTISVDSQITSPSTGAGTQNNNGGSGATTAGQWSGDYKADAPPFLASLGPGTWKAILTEDSDGNVSGSFESAITSGTVAGTHTGSNMSLNIVSGGNADFSFDGTINGNTVSGNFCGTLDGQDVTGTFWGGRIVQQSQ